MSAQRKVIFTIVTFAIPIFFFLVLEVSLRLFDYGSDLSVFKKETIDGTTYYTLNPSVKGRYFNRIDFLPDPSPEYFTVIKPEGTFRIFCLGGSTTVGYPYWYNGAFPSFLRERLHAQFPDRSIEIINLGITATNSYTVLDISKDLFALEPDLLIVYDGHNEFYGALGIASNARITPTRWMTIAYLKLVHLRTFQLARDIVNRILTLFGDDPVDYANRTTMMEQVAVGKNVPANSIDYQKALNIFKNNLNDLANLCRHHEVPLILSTQVSNLRDQRPFISNNSSELSPQQRDQFNRLYEQGKDLQRQGMLDSAIVMFHSAIAIDSTHADTHYRLAQCLEETGDVSDARIEYILARDYDELRFRTDSRFNDLIRSMGAHPGCLVADIEAVFTRLSPDSIVGKNLILEHLHPNAWGNFIIAREYSTIMGELGLLAATGDRNGRGIDDDLLWKQRHLTLVDELMAERKIKLLTSGWPFKEQPESISPIDKTDSLRFIAEQAVRGQIGWITAHELSADFYLNRKDSTKAIREYETIVNQLPHHLAANLRLTQLYFDQREFARAENTLAKLLQHRKDPVAYRALGDIYLRQGKAEHAIRCYRELARYPEDPATAPENAYMLALAYLVQGEPKAAVRILEQTIERYPSYRSAQELLARVRLHENDR